MTVTELILLVASVAVFIHLGAYMAAVFEGRVRWLALVERPVYRVLGVDPENGQSWQRYARSLIVFSGFALAIS